MTRQPRLIYTVVHRCYEPPTATDPIDEEVLAMTYVLKDATTFTQCAAEVFTYQNGGQVACSIETHDFQVEFEGKLHTYTVESEDDGIDL